MTEPIELIDAFADGERVNPEALKAALADPAARDYLIALLELRGLVHAHISLDATLDPAPPQRAWSLTSVLRPIAAIAIVGIAASAGFALGRRDSAAPASTGTPAVVVPAVIDATSAPEPTRVIRLEPGIEWHERAGGH